MPAPKATRKSLLVRCTLGTTILLSFSPVVQALSIVAPGQTQTLNPGDPVDSWQVQTGGTLNVNGAATLAIAGSGAILNLATGSSTQTIDLNGGSQANITGATITASAAAFSGFNITSSQAQIVNTDIDATANVNATGLSLIQAGANPGAVVSMTGGSVRGGEGGISLSALSTLTLDNVQVQGVEANGYGLRAFASDVSATGGSVQGGLNGIQYYVDFVGLREGTISLSGTRVTGDSGSAVAFDGFGQSMVANLQLLDGATLNGGNGTALEINGAATVNALVRNSQLDGAFVVTNDSTGNFTFDNASLAGDISADATSSASLTMANNSRLTGNLINVDSATLNASSLTGDYTISDGRSASLLLQNGASLAGNVNNVDTVALDASSLTGDYTISDSRTASLTLQNGASLVGNLINIDSVTLTDGALTGDYTITDSRTASLTLQNGASVAGNLVNVDSVALDASSMAGDYTITDSRSATLILQNAASLKGNLINVDNVTLDASSMNGDYTISDTRTASLTLQNGASLTGNLVNVDSATLDASSLTGDYTISDGRNARLALQNAARFTGNLNNVGGITLAGESIWNMVASNSVGAMSINDSSVKFGSANEFFQLDVGTLAGNGTFLMDVDFATNQHDLLNVTGVATGTHSLVIPGSGVDPASPEQLTVVRTGGGDATFALAGAGVVDVGTYSYALNSVANGTGTDWFLDPSTKTISPGTRSVLALFNTAPTVWYGELTSLRTRMGELRLNGGQAGGWARTYGNKYDVNESSGLGYQQTQQGFSLGADAPLPIGDGQWLIGVLAGHSTSDLDVSRGTSGTVKSYYVGAYTTWLDKDTGYYFDGVLKFNRFRNDAKVSMSDGARAKGDYDNVGLGGSVEFGRHIKLNDGYFVEPFTQWSTVVIQGKDYGLDNGMEAQGDRTRSLLGKVGVTAGRNFTMAGGSVVQPYVRVAGVHEFAKSNEVQVNNNTFNNDLSGSRGELGAGVAVAFNDRLQLHADFDYSNGDKIEQPFGANVGLRYSW